MTFFIASKYKIASLEEHRTADMIVDDFIDIVRNYSTKIIDNREVLELILASNPNLKYTYEIKINRV